MPNLISTNVSKSLYLAIHALFKIIYFKLEEEFQASVDNQNKVLVGRISRIMRDRGRLDNWNETYKPRR